MIYFVCLGLYFLRIRLLIEFLDTV